jgi:hypothetical protein
MGGKCEKVFILCKMLNILQYSFYFFINLAVIVKLLLNSNKKEKTAFNGNKLIIN